MKLRLYAPVLVALTCLSVMAASEFRSLTGVVVDSRGNPLPNSIVQIENANTLEVRSYVTDKNGCYRFNELYTEVDYRLRAKYHRFWSHTKTLSKLNSEEHPQMNLVVPIE
jgi:hypothetical protein